jgi:plastocyanin
MMGWYDGGHMSGWGWAASTIGTLLFLGLMVVAAFAGIVVNAHRENLVGQPAPADAGAPQLRDVVPSRPVVGGLWPVLGALALTLVLLGFLLGPVPTVAGLALAAAAVVGWTTGISADHTGRELNLLPLALPVVGLFAIFSLMFFMSRVLLAVPEWASTLVALLVTVAIMGTASMLALRPSVSSRTLIGILGGAGVVLLIAGIAAAAIGPREEEPPPGTEAGAPAVEIAAKGLKFDKAELALKSGGEADIAFNNEDSAVPHNVAVYADEAHTQQLFIGDVVVGPLKVDYKFPAPPPGGYFFRCDVHPFMSGKVTVS